MAQKFDLVIIGGGIFYLIWKAKPLTDKPE